MQITGNEFNVIELTLLYKSKAAKPSNIEMHNFIRIKLLLGPECNHFALSAAATWL